jgi:hypothetical protein
MISREHKFQALHVCVCVILPIAISHSHRHEKWCDVYYGLMRRNVSPASEREKPEILHTQQINQKESLSRSF